MEQFNQEQAEHLANLKNKRKAMFDQMNVTPTFTQDQINQGAAASNSGGSVNLAVRDRIAAIKGGHMKQEMKELNEAKNPNEFQALSVPKPKGPALTPEQEAKRAQGLKESGLADTIKPSKGSREASSLEAMFDTDSSGPLSSDVVMGNAWDNKRQQAQQAPTGTLIQEDQMMGGIGSWENSYKNTLNQASTSGQYQNPNVNPHGQKMMNEAQQMQQAPMGMNATPMGPTQITQLIESKVSEIVDSRMKAVLSELSQGDTSRKTNPNQIIGERVKSESGKYYKNAIKIDGKVYILKEVTGK